MLSPREFPRDIKECLDQQHEWFAEPDLKSISSIWTESVFTQNSSHRRWTAARCFGHTQFSRQRSKGHGSMSLSAIATCWYGHLFFLDINDFIPQFLGEVYEADDDREALWWGSLHGDLSVSRGKQQEESKPVTNWCLQSVKLDERMFFLWTKEDLADTKKLGTSCEDMEAYHERLRVRIVFTFKSCSFI